MLILLPGGQLPCLTLRETLVLAFLASVNRPRLRRSVRIEETQRQMPHLRARPCMRSALSRLPRLRSVRCCERDAEDSVIHSL